MIFSDYSDFFLFLAGLLIIGGVAYILFHRFPQNIFISQEEISKLKTSGKLQAYKISVSKISKSTNMQFPHTNVVLLAIIIGGFLFNQFLLWRMDWRGSISNFLPVSISITKKAESELKLTSFDIALAKQRMDKNNDGICDECGMKVDQCIQTGQIDCAMTKNKKGIGVLGSQHIHADFKVYVNGQALDFAKPEYYMKSSFLHVDNNQNKQDSSGVLHMHAKNVPLWLFFRSIGMKLDRNSLSLENGQVLKNENGDTLKFYLNGKKVDDIDNYIFQDLDKILISYGSKNDPDIKHQLNTITNFAKNH